MSAEKIGCGLCSRKRRVLNTSELKIGQHICEPGRNKLKYKEKQHNLKANYFHHAIIAEVKPRNDYQAELVLIHYADVTGFKKGAIKKKEEMRDLEYHEIYVVEYKYSKYPPAEVVRRAESQIKQGVGNNTEKAKDNAENDTEKIEQNAENDTEKIEQNAENNTEKIEQNAENNTEKIEQNAENNTEKIEQNAENNTEKIEQNAENNTEKIEQNAENDTEKIEQNAESDAEKIEQNDTEKIEEDIGNDTEKTKEDADNENQSEDIESVFGNYNLLKSNCEHFATWCVLGKQDCFQLDQKRKIILFPLRGSSGAAGFFSRMLLSILELFTTIISEEHTYIPGFALIGVGSGYLVYLLYSFFKLKRKQNSKCVCSYCYEEKRNILATKLVWFIFSGILIYIIIQACIPLFPAWPVTIITNVIFAILSACMQLFYKDLKSPFASKSIKVKDLSEVTQGDVVIFQQYGFKHFGIATKVTPKPGNFKSGTISFVHYKACLTSRVIAEEEIKLPEKTVWRLDLKRMTVLRPQEIIRRVRSRLGEKKWHWFSNRSDHVCYWAVNKQPHWKYYKAVKNDETESETESEQKKFSSLEVESVAVHLRKEIETGDVVKFSVHNGNIKKGDGIIIQILDSATRSVEDKRYFMLSLVMQLGKSIERSLIDIDLNTDTVEVKKFHPVHCHTMEERKSRAISALLDHENHTGDSKFKLDEFCVLKENRTSTDMETVNLKRKKTK